MVGEIRDTETALTAIQASLTGHLVFSTLHTNNAAGTFTRLIDLGADAKVLTSAVHLALAQRLVRKLCATCKVKKPITQKQKDIIGETLKSLDGFEEASVHPGAPEELFDAVGCEVCNNTGFAGRIGRNAGCHRTCRTVAEVYGRHVRRSHEFAHHGGDEQSTRRVFCPRPGGRATPDGHLQHRQLHLERCAQRTQKAHSRD